MLYEVITEDFVSRLEVLPYDDAAASHYGEIRANLEKKGLTIGVNDLHIAAHARVITSYSIHYTKLYEILFREYRINRQDRSV